MFTNDGMVCVRCHAVFNGMGDAHEHQPQTKLNCCRTSQDAVEV